MASSGYQSAAVRILIADDHEFVRLGIAACLSAYPDLHVVASVGDFHAVEDALRQKPIDIAILDIAGMGLPAGATIERLLGRCPYLRIIVCSGQTDAVSSIMSLGVHGYLTKTEYARALIEAIRTVRAGELYVSPMAQQHLVADEAFIARYRLTPKQLQIIQLVASGHNNAAIAAELCLTRGTVDNQMTRIYERTGTKGHVNLTRLYHDIYAPEK